MNFDNISRYSIQFNPDGGDLGRAPQIVDALEFSVIVPHIAYVLESLYQLGNSRMPYKYAFEFNVHSKRGVELVIMSAALPEHVSWYETDGKRIFEMRGASGGVVSNLICYLVTKTI